MNNKIIPVCPLDRRYKLFENGNKKMENFFQRIFRVVYNGGLNHFLLTFSLISLHVTLTILFSFNSFSHSALVKKS